MTADEKGKDIDRSWSRFICILFCLLAGRVPIGMTVQMWWHETVDKVASCDNVARRGSIKDRKIEMEERRERERERWREGQSKSGEREGSVRGCC